MALPLGSTLTAGPTFTVDGVPTTPSIAPTVTAARYPDQTVLTPLPSVGSPVSAGSYKVDVFTADLTLAQAGTYKTWIHTTDTTVDNQTIEWVWEDVGSGDTATFSGDAATQVDAIQAKTDLLGASTATNIISPIATDGTITVYPSRDFATADGLSIVIPVNVTLGATDTITWNAGPYGAYWATVACSYVDANNARLQLTATNAALLTVGTSCYEVVVTPFGTTRKIEAAAGALVVEAVIVA